MSFDLFVQRFQNGEVATFPREAFEEIFGRDALDPKFPIEGVAYPDGSHAEIYGNDADHLDSLMFTHFGGDRVFALIFELAERTGSVIYWPDEAPSLAVTDATVIAHIPADCLRSIGPAEVVSDHPP
jgi:hypothetical protein